MQAGMFLATRLLVVVALTLGGLGCAGETPSDRTSTDSETSAEGIAETAATTEGDDRMDPISGNLVTAEDARRAVFLDKVYYFESEENFETFRRSPEEYATTTCPVTGEPVPIPFAKAKAEYAGRTWYFNTKSDMLVFRKNPEKYATYRCPGCGRGGLISAPTTVTETFEGHELHFCCADCRDTFADAAIDSIDALVPEGGTADTTRVGEPGE